MTDTSNLVFEGTPEQQAYAAETIHNRVRAESRMMTAKAALWWLGGAGAFLALLGVGIAAVLWAYARYADVTSTAEQLAGTLSSVLEKVTVETKGEVRLANGGMVSLDAKENTIGITPGSTVRIEGAVVASNGSSSSSQGWRTGSTLPATTSTGQKVVSDFIVFQHAEFGAGGVHTGWKFHSNNDPSPYEQYCYYAQIKDGDKINVDLADNGVMTPPTSNFPLDRVEASKNCVWFNNQTTQSANIAPTTAPATMAPPTTVKPPSTTAVPSGPAQTVATWSGPTGLPGAPPMPSTSSMDEWQVWCRTVYIASMEQWCLNTWRLKAASAPTAPSPDPIDSQQSGPPQRSKRSNIIMGKNGPLKMDPSKQKLF